MTAALPWLTITATRRLPNRLQSIALGAGGTRTLLHDASGNVTSDTSGGVTKTYAYNAAGRMESLTFGTDVTEYVYNALGQQVIRRLSSGQTLHVVHDADGNRLAEYDYDAATQTSTLLREYIWLDGEAVGVVEGGVVYFVRSDHIGRPVFATDGTGAKVWTASYLPFGGVETSTGNPIELRFPGQWFQSESGLHQNWMREYDPTTGRYLQADPLGLVDGASVYGYALQNPGRYVDPRGEDIIGPAAEGFGSYYGGILKCIAGGCSDVRVGQAGAAFAKALAENPGLAECLLKLLDNIKEDQIAFTGGRFIGAASTNAMIRIATRGRLNKRSLRLAGASVFLLGSAAGNLSSFISKYGNPTPSQFAQFLTFGELIAPNFNCSCSGE